MQLYNITHFRMFVRDMLCKSISDDYVDIILEEIYAYEFEKEHTSAIDK